MSANASVEPISDIDRAVGTNGDIGGAELVAGLLAHLAGASNKVGAEELILEVGREETAAVELEGRAFRSGLIVEDRVPSRLAGQEGAHEGFPECSVLIHGDSGGRTAAVDIAGVHCSGVELTPVSALVSLAGAFDIAVALLAIACEVSRTSVFQDVGNTTSRWIVVVVLEGIAKGTDGLLVGISVAVSGDFGIGAVGIHADGEA